MGWFGLRFVFCIWNVYWFSFIVGSFVLLVSVLLIMFVGVVLCVGCMVLVVVGIGDVR